MIMPVVYDYPDYRSGVIFYRRGECRSCGDDSVLRIQRYDFPQLVNAYGDKRFQFAAVESVSKCAYCYL